MKLNKNLFYHYVIFFSVSLIFLDAYEIFDIPVSWIGMTCLLPISLIEYKKITTKNQKSLLFYMFLVVSIPTFFYLTNTTIRAVR